MTQCLRLKPKSAGNGSEDTRRMPRSLFRMGKEAWREPNGFSFRRPDCERSGVSVFEPDGLLCGR